ncbi:MAG: DUF2203 domain-containing protein [Deltaproteobacteria bacterium]|nr:DUF2203 domain-containing protein [Deltaproteobacteria bacterium]
MTPASPSSKRIFTYGEALDTFPGVRQSTARAVRRIEALVNSLRSRQEMEDRKPELESACQAIVTEWVEEVTIVGCEVKGLWLVDWDSGDGYYCWRYPEDSLAHYHGYEEGFEGRVPIH